MKNDRRSELRYRNSQTDDREKRRGKISIKKVFLSVTADLLAAALLLAAIYGVNYLLPQNAVMAQDMTQMELAQDAAAASGSSADMTETASSSQDETETSSSAQGETEISSPIQDQQSVSTAAEANLQNMIDSNAGGLPTTKVTLDTQDWHEKFADKFTDQVVSTDTSYTSPDVSVQLTYASFDTNKLDYTENGKHKKYGTNISYVLADIYVGDITCLQTCFAQNTYGVGYSEMLSDMSARLQSVLAINGDSYSNSRHENNGTIIRNGVIYRAQSTDMETCVLNWDGTMKIYSPQELDTQQLIDSGGCQSWVFGPSLLDSNGKANTTFQTWSYITESHPRTAIGYYEPGHYCFLVVNGRQSTSRGMFLDEMSSLFEQLGCKAAYNLDGGHCSFMTLQDQVVSQPYKPQHTIQDGIFIMEGLL